MRTVNALWVALVCAMLPWATRAAERGEHLVHQCNAWSTANVRIQVASRWWLVPEVHWRRAGGFGHALQEGVLLAPEHHLRRWTLQPGYGYWRSHPYGRFLTPATQREHRTWLQLGYQHPLMSWQLDHRLRGEQRFLERHVQLAEDPVSNGFKYVGRLRYRTRLVAPLNSKNGRAGEWQAILQQEAMIRFGDSTFRRWFDQVRPMVQLAYRPLEHVRITGGYQLQYLVRGNGIDAEMNHTMMLGAIVWIPQRERGLAQVLGVM